MSSNSLVMPLARHFIELYRIIDILDDRFEYKGLDSWQQSLNEAALTDECSSILLFVIGSGRQAQHTRQFGFSDTVLR